VLGTDIEPILAVAIFHEVFKQHEITSVTSLSDLQSVRQKEMTIPVIATAKAIDLPKLSRNKKGNIILDHKPFYSKFTKAKHERR
jgi:hypothetical protein